MIKRKMLRHGSVATAWWYMADEDALATPVPSAKHLQRRDDPGIYDGMLENLPLS
jgi:hypothetical protein